jgi:hypothetical protein
MHFHSVDGHFRRCFNDDPHPVTANIPDPYHNVIADGNRFVYVSR